MINILAPFAIGFVALYLGSMGFSRGGIPFTKEKHITGTPAKIVGAVCLLLGVALVGVGVWAFLRISR